MRRTISSLTLMAVTVCAIASAAASARLDLNPPRADAAAVTCGKDYSKNSVNGDYCVSSTAGPVAAAAHPSTGQSAVAVNADGFSWSSAAAGAGAALVLVLAAAGVMVASRRRHRSSTVGPRHSPTTG